jgi:signal transduction histidine kinase
MEEHRTPVRVLQPELVGVMRLFAIFQVFKSLVLAILVFLHGEPVMSVIFLPLVTSIGFLVYVYLDFLRAETGRWYLIVTVTLFTIDTLMTKSTFWLRDVFAEHLLRADSSDYSLQLLIGGFTSGIALVWNPFFHMSMLISLLMLLIVLSWQYDFRYSLGFTLVTSVFDFILNVLLVTDDAASIASSLTIILGRTFIFTLVGRLTTHLVGVQNAQQRSLVRANANLARQAVVVEDLAISRERNRMARELHDTLAHTLSAAAVQIEAATAQQRFDEAKSRAALERAGSTIRGGLNEMRRALRALRASPLEDLGFELALRELVDQTQQRSGAAVKMLIADGLRLWSSEEEHALYRVVQESLENIVRHSEAHFVQVELRQDERVTALDIWDDGVGFDVGLARSDAHRFGLRGIVERVEALGGRVHIESSPGKGTLIAVRMEN